MRTSVAPPIGGALPKCASRFDLPRVLLGMRGSPESSSNPVDASGLVPCVRTAPRAMQRQLFMEVLHGEFDPGSGRTLAACLTHASGATNQGVPWGRAANG